MSAAVLMFFSLVLSSAFAAPSFLISTGPIEKSRMKPFMGTFELEKGSPVCPAYVRGETGFSFRAGWGPSMVFRMVNAITTPALKSGEEALKAGNLLFVNLSRPAASWNSHHSSAFTGEHVTVSELFSFRSTGGMQSVVKTMYSYKIKGLDASEEVMVSTVLALGGKLEINSLYMTKGQQPRVATCRYSKNYH